jgi:DeoR/GlpR family transcriptional regulator of sugar metabolism
VARSAPRRSRSRPLHAADRRHTILARVAEEQTIHVGELARDLGCSEMTIRRDIRRLERDGFIRQTYGGATAHVTRSFDISFNARALLAAREKRLIGMRAASLIETARVLFVGIGSTAEQFARYLPARADLTVVTPSLPIASLLGTRPFRVVALGGAVLRDELTCNGPIAIATLARYRFDAAVIGAAGISAHWGVTELTEEEAAVQRAALERTERVIVIADGSKVGASTPIVVGPATLVTTLVTDPSASAAELDKLSRLGIEVLIAERAAPARQEPTSQLAAAAAR